MAQDPRSSREARAARLCSLRRLTRQSRREFAEKHDIPASNFQNWEGPRYGGLTEKAAIKLAEIFNCEGVICSAEWLLHGIGQPPQTTEKLFSQSKEQPTAAKTENTTLTNEDELISKELLVFRQHYGETLELIIVDDAMIPLYKPGDYIAGKKTTHDFQQFINHDCIIQLSNGELLVRHLKEGSRDDLFTLAAINVNTSVNNPIIYETKIHSIAPIMWLRRRDRCN